jgi:hypothetical protein
MLQWWGNDYLCNAGRYAAQLCRRAISDHSAALVARAGVRCATCVGAHERAISDYSGKFP